MPNAAPASAKIEASSVEPERPEVRMKTRRRSGSTCVSAPSMLELLFAIPPILPPWRRRGPNRVSIYRPRESAGSTLARHHYAADHHKDVRMRERETLDEMPGSMRYCVAWTVSAST